MQRKTSRNRVALLFVAGLAACTSAGVEPPVPSPESAASRPDASAHGPCIPSLMFPALNVVDLRAAEAFYVGMMGMEVTLRLGDEKSEKEEVTLNFTPEGSGCGAGLVLQRERDRTRPYVFDGFSRVAFRVPDVEALVGRMRRAGYAILTEPRIIEVTGLTIKLAFVEDPNGARVELIEIVPTSDD